MPIFRSIAECLEVIYKSFRPPKRKRLELRLVPYDMAGIILRESNGAWTIAKEEDSNRKIGYVYLERLEPATHFENHPNIPPTNGKTTVRP